MSKTAKIPPTIRRYIAALESRRTHILLRHAVRLEELLKDDWVDHLANSGHSVAVLTRRRRWRLTGFELADRTRWRSHRTDETTSSIGEVCDWIKDIPALGLQSSLEARLVHIPELGLLTVLLHGSADQILFIVRAGFSGLNEAQLVARCRYQPQLRSVAEQRLHQPAPALTSAGKSPQPSRQPPE